ncbi:MAG: hypothetical protein IIZ67_03850, partial [Bacilli bacterium]|nr:hypothetical protein [Bacilli bacterium]
MKRIFKLLFILLISVFLVGCKDANKVFKTKPSVDETVYKEVDEVMANMSLDEKIGQMFIVSYNSTSYNDGLSNIMST